MISWILTSVFLFWSKFQLIRYTPRVWGKSADGTVFGTYVLQTAPLYHELMARSVLETVAAIMWIMHTQLTEDKCPNCFYVFLSVDTGLQLTCLSELCFILFCNGYKSDLQLMFAVFVFRQITRLTGYFSHHAWLRRLVCIRTFLQRYVFSVRKRLLQVDSV